MSAWFSFKEIEDFWSFRSVYFQNEFDISIDEEILITYVYSLKDWFLNKNQKTIKKYIIHFKSNKYFFIF